VLGRRTNVTDPSGLSAGGTAQAGTTQFEYDRWDNLIVLTDAENQRTEFEYYPDGKLKLERRPLGEETRYEYDRFGRLCKILDAKGQTTEYGYDDQWRLETIAYADGNTVSYDDDGNLSGYSDCTDALQCVSASYTYDDMGRKLTETVNYGPFSKTFEYTYYGNGPKHIFTAPDSTVYTYTYGFNNELQSIQISGVGNIEIPDYTWNRPATVNYPGGTQRSYTYDALMRLESFALMLFP
jgi:YD repeat-containing protein